ncbi:MAG: hypothetical protein LBI18_13925, partial [Planctomycetaceae bacterium]|nr:hypothetical protein [Planctomycetaceae bacterium]
MEKKRQLWYPSCVVTFLFPTVSGSQIQGGFSMTAVINNSTFSLHCQSEVSDGCLSYTGTFTRTIPLAPGQNALDSLI